MFVQIKKLSSWRVQNLVLRIQDQNTLSKLKESHTRLIYLLLNNSQLGWDDLHKSLCSTILLSNFLDSNSILLVQPFVVKSSGTMQQASNLI